MTKAERTVNLIAVVLPFAAFIAAIVLLWNSLVGWTDLVAFAVMYLIAGFGVTVGYHRLLTRDRDVRPEDVGGFLALESPRAGALREALAERGVMADSRGRYLRLGPAPYLSDAQLREAVALLGDAAESVAKL